MAATILFVEDSALVRQVMKTSLTLESHGVFSACDGQDALTKLNVTKSI